MKKRLIIKTILALAILVVAGCTAPFAYADEERINITLSPTKDDITLTPGETYKGSFTLGNFSNSNAPLDYDVSVQTMSISDSGYTPTFGVKNVPNSDIVDWVSLNQDSGTLNPQESAKIEYTIKVPADAKPGGQYAGIIVQRTNNKVEKDRVGVAQKDAIGYILYANVAGQTTKTGSILENNVPSFFLTTPLTATTMVENTGTTHDYAVCKLKVFPLFSNEEYYTNEEEPQKYVVLPDTKRFISQSWNADTISPVGIYRMEQTIEFMGQTSTATKIIILCPLWLLLVIVFVIVFIIVWLVMRNKNRKANKGKSAGKSSKPSSTSSTTSNRPTPSDKPESKPDTTATE